MVLYIKVKGGEHNLEGITDDVLKQIEWEGSIQDFIESNDENLAYFENIIFDEALFENESVAEDLEQFQKKFTGRVFLLINRNSGIKKLLDSVKNIFFLEKRGLHSLKTQYRSAVGEKNADLEENEGEDERIGSKISKKERFMKAKKILEQESSAVSDESEERIEEEKTEESGLSLEKEMPQENEEESETDTKIVLEEISEEKEEEQSAKEDFRDIEKEKIEEPSTPKKTNDTQNDIRKMSRAERIAHIRQANLQADAQKEIAKVGVEEPEKQEPEQEHKEPPQEESREPEKETEEEKLRREIAESLCSTPEEVKKRTENVQKKMEEYKDPTVYEKKDLLKFMRKRYDTDEEMIVHKSADSLSNDEEIELDLSDIEVERKSSSDQSKKISFPRIPKINIRKTAKKQETEEEERKESTIVLPSTGRVEIGVIGTTRGVGTTFTCFYFAKKYGFKKSVAYVANDSKDAIILKKAQEEGFIEKHIIIYDVKEILSAYKECEVVIVDFGVMDRSNKELMVDFERCHEKFVVTNFSFNKRFSFNNLLQYHNEGSQFTAVLNFMTVPEYETIQRMFKDVSMINIPYLS